MLINVPFLLKKSQLPFGVLEKYSTFGKNRNYLKLLSILTQIKHICCIGAGYVGGPTMAVIAQKCPNVKVTVVDLNAKRIAAWNHEDLTQLPIYEPGLAEVVKEARGRNLFFSTEIEKAIDEAQMIFISVILQPRPMEQVKGWQPNLKYLSYVLDK